MYGRLTEKSIVVYEKIYSWIRKLEKENGQKDFAKVTLPKDLGKEFSQLVNELAMNMLEEPDNFYGYFLLQMERQVDFTLASPTGINFTQGKFILYLNPLIFLSLTVPQMFTTMQHEILHLLSLHLQRVKTFQGVYSKLVINLAMDVTVNNYLQNLPPDAVTLAGINRKYGLKLPPYESLDFYLEKLQKAIKINSQKNPEESGEEEGDLQEEGTGLAENFAADSTHDLWETQEPVEDKVLNSFIEEYADKATRGKATGHVADLVKVLKSTLHELPWEKYLGKMLGSLATGRKNTTARRNRRQPERLDLPGQLRRYQPKVGVALDVSGSISDGEFKQAMKEVLALVRTYKEPITVMECDDRLRKVYKVRSVHDLQPRYKEKAGTSYAPVIGLANKEKFDLLVYFTDGQGEKQLEVAPQGYKILWVLSGDGEKLSLKNSYGLVKRLQPIKQVSNILDSYDVEHGGFSMNHQEEITLGNEY